MKRLFVALLGLMCIFNAYADNNNTTTSKDYVDAQIATLQDEVPAINSNTVLTHTGTSGQIGSKKIYDANSDYGSQTDALMTAGAFNTAVQNAIDTEFVCIDWLGEHVPGNCLLWKIQNKTPNQIVPDGYTQLEYLESTGTQYIDTGILLSSESKIEFKFSSDGVSNYAVFGASNGSYYNNGEISLFWNRLNAGSLVIEAVRPTSNSNSTVVLPRPTMTADTLYSVSYDKNNLTINGAAQPSNWFSNYRGQRTCYIFASNRGSNSWIGGNTKLYWFRIYNDNTLDLNFIPARRDNVLGMYDTVSNTFFTNSGSGTFVAGPEDMNSNLYLPTGN